MIRVQDELDDFITAEMDQPVMKEAHFLAQKLAKEMGDQAQAVLFYGSCLRTGDGAGLMDFYILTKGALGYGDGLISRAAHKAVPPFVRYYKCEYEGQVIHAKVAIMTLSHFVALARPGALDISIWARFAQPTALIYARDDAATEAVHDALRNAIMTAMNWAVYFGPDEGAPGAFWCALFRATYAAELRIEDASRADLIVELAAARYDTLFLPALIAAGFLPSSVGKNTYHVPMENNRRKDMRRQWLVRRITSKSVNLLRIFKGAVTFEGRADYVAWKIERRTGITLSLTPWQRAHPLLSAPQILAQMWKKGAFQKRH
ncbi:MAG: hypothetical protein COA85_04025 [Robiginitomaculum sp.]|nr:MAG: hypothetical protein COA85_04025 [Robiginitomaculum sp.]